MRSILAGVVLPALHGHVLYKNWHLCRVCWEDCERKNLHVPTPPEVATNITGLLKVDQGERQGCLQPSGCKPSPPPKPQASLSLTSRGKSSQRLGVETKQHITRKSSLPKTPIVNRTVDLDPQLDKTINSPV